MTRWPLALLATAALFVAGCGDDDDSKESSSTTTTAAASADLGAIKTYLLEHTALLKGETAKLKGLAEQYAAASRAQRPQLVKQLQESFRRANPAYEEMEGIVAGVPSLADFDVIIDAGGDASDPENAVPFSIKTEDGRTFKQPGNFNYLIETAVFGTEPKFQIRGVRSGFGNPAPDPDFLAAAARDFDKAAADLDTAAKAWDPTPADAFNAVVVMTPTMSEYFEAWKNSRAIAGSKATEKAFVAASRLEDIADILGGVVLIYDNIKPTVAKADAAQAEQTGKELVALEQFASKLRDQEAAGKSFSAQDADTLGGEAQDRAEAIAGQVSQAAGRLNIELAE